MPALDDRVKVETLKLLVSVAWADHEVVDAEVDYLLGLAEQSGARDELVIELRMALADQKHMPAPDLRLLREHRAEVLRTVDELIAVDDRIVSDEVAARDAIAGLLGDE